MAQLRPARLLAAAAAAASCFALLLLVNQRILVSSVGPSVLLSQASRNAKIAAIDSWEKNNLRHSWKGEHREGRGALYHADKTPIRTTYKMAQARAMRSIERENEANQKRKAAKDEKKASELVGFAKKLAQKVVAREAIDEMKHWIDQHPPKQLAAAAASSSMHAATGATASQLHTARPHVAPKRAPAPKARAAAPSKPVVHKTQAQELKEGYTRWQEKKLRGYASENSLFTAQEYCNSKTVTAHPSIEDLKASFGDDWREVAARHPQVASMAAVTSCLEALGLADPKLQPVSRKAWKSGPLKGKEGAVTLCAAGDEDACAELAKDKGALAGLKKLMPSA